MSGVWVWIEHRDGEMAAISQELLGVGREIATGVGESLTALVFGQDVQNVGEARDGQEGQEEPTRPG